MTDREKIISIIEQNKYCDVNTTANCRECRYNKELANYKDMGCSSLKIADALIAANIGDVKAWKERAEKHRFMALPDGRIKQLYSDEEVEQIVKERDEYKHRAEVAERALSWLCDETMRDIRIIMYPTIGKQVRDKQELYDYCIEQAERGELVEAPKGSVVLTPEERKQAVKVFAERVKMAFYYEFDELIPSIMADKIDELVAESLANELKPFIREE